MNATPTSSQKGQKTILVVEDDAAVLRFVVQLLAREEYNILTATDGSDCLQKSREFKDEIHLLLSDFRMPEMSGVELAIAFTRERPNVKILLVSGFGGEMPVLNEGWHFLSKPFVGSQLRALVASILAPEE